MAVKGNIEAREAAEEAMEYAVCCCNDYLNHSVGSLDDSRFWEELVKLMAEHLPQVSEKQVCQEIRKMTQAEAKRFGCELLPFGGFSGEAVDQVPLDRLQWYADQTFTDELRRYLRSDRVSHAEGNDGAT